MTAIVRDGSGAPQAIVAPGGQRTGLTVDANGFLARVENPAGEVVQLASTPDGLIETFRDARGYDHTISYGPLGRLAQDADPAGGFTYFDRTASAGGFTVTATTAEGHSRTYQVAQASTGARVRTVTGPDGLTTVTPIGTDGVRTTTRPDGTVVTRAPSADPRFGLMAPATSTQTRLPSGLTATLAESRRVTLVDPADPTRPAAVTIVRTMNGNAFTQTYDAATRTRTDVSAMGRIRTTMFDAAGRVVATQQGPLAPVMYGYDALGLLATLTRGTGPDARVTTLTYDAARRLRTLTDPLGRTTASRLTLRIASWPSRARTGRSSGWATTATGM